MKTPVIILGMHRSGTSCLTGCLEDAGLFLGRVNRHATFNQKGNKENFSIVQFHDQILTRVGASWDIPPSKEIEWTASEKATLQELIADYPEDQLWGLKDPRTLFLLSGWKELTNPTFVGTFRHPSEVVASLVSRSEQQGGALMSKEHAYELWKLYNLRMLDIYKRQKFNVIRYDVPVNQYKKNILILTSHLNLKPKNEDIPFLDQSLRQNRWKGLDLPIELRGIWRELIDISLK